MIRKRVWRYYCEHCKRSGCSGGHMARHERGCTANPSRVCGFHEAMRATQPQMAALLDTVKEHYPIDPAAMMVALRDAADDCPACILSALRQSGIQREEDYDGIGMQFDFRAEVDKFWKERNAEGWASDMGASY